MNNTPFNLDATTFDGWVIRDKSNNPVFLLSAETVINGQFATHLHHLVMDAYITGFNNGMESAKELLNKRTTKET